MSSAQAAADWLAAREAKRRAEAVYEEAKKTLARAEERALDAFEREGCSSVRVHGHNVHLKRSVHASVKAGEGAAVVAALRDHGLDDLIKDTVNPRTLSKWVREREQEGEKVPDSIAEHLHIAELFTIGALKSTRGAA